MQSSRFQQSGQILSDDYLLQMEQRFKSMIQMDSLDVLIESKAICIEEFDAALKRALETAFEKNDSDASSSSRLFLQRILYSINRLKLFWYDDLDHYKNERSLYLRGVRDRIESKWEAWELTQFDYSQLEASIEDELCSRAKVDVAPEPTSEARYFRDTLSIAGYRRLLEIASLDGLVEASQLSRTLGGVGNEIHSMMTRLLVEEYGGGRLNRKHSSFFTVMLEALGMKLEPEAYLPVTPWEVLATINHSFLLSERKRYYLRYVGGLLFTEISVPAAFENYRIAAQRLSISDSARAYWELHIREDERHGQWMLNDVALPLSRIYPKQASEILLGYVQQKFMSDRAGRATLAEVVAADNSVSTQTLYEVAA